MRISRRSFLKALAVVPAAIAFPGVISADITSSAECLLNPNDIILSHTETIYNELRVSYLYRGVAHKRNDPENKKYFAAFIDDVDGVADKAFTDNLYDRLEESFS